MLNIAGKIEIKVHRYWCMLFQLTSHYITLNKLIFKKNNIRTSTFSLELALSYKEMLKL